MATSAVRRTAGFPMSYASVASGQVRQSRLDASQNPTTGSNPLSYGQPLYPAQLFASSTTLGLHQDGLSDQSTPPVVPNYLSQTAFTDHLAQPKPSHEESYTPLPTEVAKLGKPMYLRNTVVDTADQSTHSARRPFQPLPTKWNENDKGQAVEVLADGLEVKFQGTTKNENEASTVRADHPVPVKCGIFYFEVTVFSRGKEGLIGVGFCEKTVDLTRLPGWEAKSWGYHGDDGKAFGRNGNGQGEPYGPSFASGDTIGCGINMADHTAFFTKNGVFLGTAFRDLKGTLYPAVGMQKDPEHIRANFGSDRFVYDIQNHIWGEKRKLYEEKICKASIASITPKVDEHSFIHSLVTSYLAHEGYVDTLRALTNEAEEDPSKSSQTALHFGNVEALKTDVDVSRRQSIRNAVLNGNIDEVIRLTDEYYPEVLKNNSKLHFRLRCRKLKEMIAASMATESVSSNGKSADKASSEYEMEVDGPHSNDWDNMDSDENRELNAAISYANQLKKEFNANDSPANNSAINEAFGLIAFPDPKNSPIFAQDGRKAIADDLNSAILVSQGRHSVAALGRLVQQTAVLVEEVSNYGGPTSLINVQRDFLSSRKNPY
ncbi:SPRY-domain-containing protein [Ascobolus immersus RN42]|uniref:SPRY-domain-containing protein n=1 Tax=Ascobolus immersus RN42 TaxID=1160509 RepID=A0A3N4IHX9_ASCIM|nr:SPRY-domain-containing protein [Ascobolus immersus RN42]